MTKVEPSFVIQGSGAVLTVTGAGLSTVLTMASCFIQEAEVPLTIRDNDRGILRLPSSVFSGSHDMFCTYNGQDRIAGTLSIDVLCKLALLQLCGMFSHKLCLAVVDVTAVQPSSFPSTGGVVISLTTRKDSFSLQPRTGAFLCQFDLGAKGVELVPAEPKSSSVVQCTVPLLPGSGQGVVYVVSSDGFKGSGAAVEVTGKDELSRSRAWHKARPGHTSISSVIPTLVSGAGGCLLTLIGGPFSQADSYSCLFEGSPGSLQGVFLARDSIRCLVPVLKAGSSRVSVVRDGTALDSSTFEVTAAGATWIF